jgi:hypothetical protein
MPLPISETVWPSHTIVKTRIPCERCISPLPIEAPGQAARMPAARSSQAYGPRPLAR